MSLDWHILPSAIVLKVSGKDARRYLNSRLSNDLRAAQPGDAVRAAALTAQGRVEGLFTVFVQPSDTFYLACDAGPREEVVAAFKRFIVADRVTVEDLSAQACLVHIAAEKSHIAALLQSARGELLGAAPCARVGETGSDCLLLGASHQQVADALRAQLGEPLSSDEYRLRRFKHGLPVFPDEVNGETILTEAGLYDAASFTKGCYVGQEVLERSDAIGKLPRALELIRLSGATPPAPGSAVTSSAGDVLGKAVSAAVDEAQAATFLFALLRTGKYGVGDKVACAGMEGEIVLRRLTGRNTGK